MADNMGSSTTDKFEFGVTCEKVKVLTFPKQRAPVRVTIMRPDWPNLKYLLQRSFDACVH